MHMLRSNPHDVHKPSPLKGRPTVVLILTWFTTVQWSGVMIGPAQVSDLVLAVIAAIIVVGPRQAGARSVPTGAWVMLAILCAANMIALIAPPEPSWLTMRFTSAGGGQSATRSGLGSAGLGAWAVPFKLLLATVGAWSVLQRLHQLRPESARRLFGYAWLAGSVVSAAVAFGETKGLDLSAWLAQPFGEQTRASGLAFYPNSAALYFATSVPVSAMLLRRRATFVPAIVALVVLWAGLVAADSRIALAAAAVATALLPLLCGHKPGRAALIAFFSICFGGFIAIPALSWITSNTRLAPGAGSGSDVGRDMVNQQSVLDFLHSPIYGLGFSDGGGGISVPLSVLSSSGIIGGLGALAFVGWAVHVGIAGWADGDVRIMLVAGAVVLAVMCFQNNLVDRGQYIALLLAVLWSRQYRAPALNQDVGISAWRVPMGASRTG
ncbi:hypothetical protein KIH74_22855 [Kineosporia sp. J2-2]|uniref:O-antigen ligase n=1 Tax=Kineosporia corallincola TaxID=2835133 RepID=A0ABS5TL23_9ACTN|nr:hypothetical protein [Kineosporia corallincola]MBT0771799.1 hypothetical protein [Kineosporia corallincola]